MYDRLNIGVLALQGDFERHLYRLRSLNVSCREVRVADDLTGLDGLIIPGGESTTMNNLMDRFHLRERLAAFISEKAVWGTCAGMIMLANETDDPSIQTFKIINISVIRNGYGRQVHSFFDEIKANLNGHSIVMPVSFIRAPLVTSVGEGVKVLAVHDGNPILLSQGRCLVSSFHSELHDDSTLLKYFLESFVNSPGVPSSIMAK